MKNSKATSPPLRWTLAAAAFLASLPVHAATYYQPVNWNEASVTFDTVTGEFPAGDDPEDPGLGISVAASGLMSIATGIYGTSGTDFEAQQLGLTTFLEYPAGADWTLTFSAPVNLYVYGLYWRGLIGPSHPRHYTFDAPFTIASGFTEATLSGNTLILPETGYHHGILSFTNVTTLHVISDADAAQAMTIAASPAPEPSLAALFALGAPIVLARRIRNQ